MYRFVPVLGLLLSAAPLAAQHRIDLYAGGSLRTGAPAREVALAYSQGIAYDPSGRIVFAETSSNLIRRIAADGKLETVAGNGETGASGDGGPAVRARLNYPMYPRYDAAGKLYFADVANSRIRRVDPGGVITTVAGTGSPFRSGMDLDGPALRQAIGSVNGLAVTPSGVLYFSEEETYAIRRVSGGRIERFAGARREDCYCSDGDGGPALKAHFNRPASLALDDTGNLYVSEAGGHVRRISTGGIIDRFAGYGSRPPLQGTAPPDEGASALDIYIGGNAALAAGADGSLYVADSGFPRPSRIRRLHDGIADTVPGSEGKGAYDLAVARGGALALIDSTGVNVLSAGVFANVAGGAPKSAPDGLPARDAWLLSPSAIAVASNGDLYIAERGACAIRKIGADGLLRTAAGTGKCAESLPLRPATGTDLAPPASMTIDRQNRIWISDTAANFYRLDPDGSIAIPALPPVIGPGAKLAIDSRDRIYVLGMFSLFRVWPDGKLEAIANPPSAPGVPPAGFGPTLLRAIGVDPSGNVYFTGTYLGERGDSIFRVNDDATFTRVYTGSSNSFALAVDGRGTVWQADSGVSLFDAGGSRAVGLGAAGYAGDGGPLQSARMGATGIALSPSGDVFLLDGNRIRKITGDHPKVRPAVASGGVVNAFSFAGGGIASNELISIFGSGFATAPAVSTLENNRYPLILGDTRVWIDGLSVPILAATPTQLNVLAPTGLITGKTARVVVSYDTAASAPVDVPIVESAFGLATLDGTGAGQGAILNQDGAINSAAAPAARGSIVSLFGSGAGATLQDLIPGSLVISTPYPAPAGSVTATVGGQPAELLYAGSAPLLPYGILQINARVPSALGAGSHAVVVTVSGIASPPVTVVVR